MRHDNSVFHQLTKFVDWRCFEAAVDEYKSDYRIRTLNTKSQFLALLFGQLSGASSLREIESGLASHGNLLYHCGAGQAARSTLSDANRNRPAEVFEALLAAMVMRATRGVRRSMGQAMRLLDATRVPLSSASKDWAHVYEGKCGAKVHVMLDPDACLPLKVEVSPANVNDITPAKSWPIEEGATYVFDMAYYDYQWWADLDAAGCRFVTRLKKHTRPQVMELRDVPSRCDILSDAVVKMTKRLARSRTNPLTKPLREITLRIETGKVLRLVTNDLDTPAAEIGELYRMRWQIELFFKWIKQNLNIKKFIGTSQNAIRIQIAVAMIAYLLIRMAHAAQKTVTTMIRFIGLVTLNLMHKKPITNLQNPPPEPKTSTNQLSMEWT